MAKDPVCGMEVNESDAAAKTEHGDKMFYFCSAGCKEAFEKDPQQYMS